MISVPFKNRWCALFRGLAVPLAKEMLHHDAKSEIWTDVSPLQPEKAEPPMLPCALFITAVSPLQFLNAFSPILITELEIINVPVKLLQPENADAPILVTELGMDNVPVSPLHPEKADVPMVTTDSPKDNPVSPLQLPKALLPMFVTELGIVNVPVNPLHP